jgi:hypothetical protein
MAFGEKEELDPYKKAEAQKEPEKKASANPFAEFESGFGEGGGGGEIGGFEQGGKEEEVVE